MIISQEQILSLSSNELYDLVRLSPVSQNCLYAVDDYFEIISQICPVREDVAHSILRTGIRPMFYLGITSYEQTLSYIKETNPSRSVFLGWLAVNSKMVKTIVIELTVCCFFYNLSYSQEKSIVILNNKVDEHMESVFVEIPNKEIHEEFRSFSEFLQFFRSFCKGYGITSNEIDRLILEEEFEKNYFSAML